MVPLRTFPDTRARSLSSTTVRNAGPIRLRCGRAVEKEIGWRTTLCSIIMAGGLAVFDHRTAYAGPDACTVGPANVVTCAGNQSGGIDAGTDFTVPAGAGPTLVIKDLTGDITPTNLPDGIRWAVGLAGAGPINII